MLSFLTSVSAASCPTFRVIHQPDFSLINASVAPDNKYGIEDGIVVRTSGGALYMIGSEMYADPKWVNMRLGIWRSEDGYKWARQRSLRQSSGVANGTDQHAASWGPFLLWDPTSSRWALSYVSYRSGGAPFPGWSTNWDGQIFFTYAPVTGDAGLDSDFGDSGDWRSTDRMLLGPEPLGPPWPPCQGLQGTDSMYPYQLADGTWAALVGTSHQEASWRPVALGEGKWFVSLATAPTLNGPWTRHNPHSRPADAPCVNISNGHTENPIVSRQRDGGFLAIFDHLAAQSRGFGVSCSADGMQWDSASVVEVGGGVRTPLGLIELQPSELAAHAQRIAAYGVTTTEQILAANSSVYFAFYTQTVGGWEQFRTVLVEQLPAAAAR